MGIFFVYILKSSVCLAMFYLFYRLLLSKETFHRFNRVALLGVLVLSCLIPMIEVTTHDASGFLVLEEMILMAEVEPAGVLDETSNPFPWRALMLLVYMAGILFFVIRHLWSLGRMLRLLRVSRKEDLGDGITLFVHDDKEVAPFSWMKNIAVSETDLAESREAVLMPSGGQQGRTVELIVGGQQVWGLKGAMVSGGGVTVESVEAVRGFPYPPWQQRQYLKKWLDGIEKGMTPPEEITENIFAMNAATRKAKGIPCSICNSFLKML